MLNKTPQTKNEVVEILKEFKTVDLFNYEVHDDLSISINGDVDLSNKKLTQLPVSFNIIKGNFSCSHNNLISLKGAPKKVSNTFSANHNKIIFLKDLPQCPEIFLGHNNIKSLDNIPEETKFLDLSFNNINLISVQLMQQNNYKIESINLSNNKIIDGIDNLMNCKLLDRIYLNDNKINSMEDFKHFPKLRILSLRDNRINKFIWDNNFSKNLIFLNLGANEIKELYVDPKIELNKLCVSGKYLEKIEVNKNTMIAINYSQRTLIEQIDFHQKYPYSLETTHNKLGERVKNAQIISENYIENLKKKLYLRENL